MVMTEAVVGYGEQIRKYFIAKYGEDPNEAGAPDAVPDGWQQVPINGESWDVLIQSGRVSGFRLSNEE